MALSLATLQEAVGYIKLALDIYNDIQAVPAEIAELKVELEGLGAPLSTLANLLKGAKEADPLGRLDNKNRSALVDAVQDASAACKEVHSVFKNVKSRHLGSIGGHDIRARTQWLAWAWHRLGFGADKVKGLMDRIRTRCQGIQFILSIVNILPKKRLQASIVAQQKEKAALEKSRKEIQFLRNDAAKKDAQLQAINAQLKVLTDALVKTRAEAKRAKERECMDTATAVNGQAQKKAPKPTTNSAKKVAKEPSGPGQLSKTPSMGPKVIRGEPKRQKGTEGENRGSGQERKPKNGGSEQKTNGSLKEKKDEKPSEKTNGKAKHKVEKPSQKTNGSLEEKNVEKASENNASLKEKVEKPSEKTSGKAKQKVEKPREKTNGSLEEKKVEKASDNNASLKEKKSEKPSEKTNDNAKEKRKEDKAKNNKPVAAKEKTAKKARNNKTEEKNEKPKT